VLGIEGGELIAMAEIAMLGGLPYTALRDGIFAHPTLAESFNNLFAMLDG
jgi:pyruvate/2-oxoglutarate dehydrogenase complex dihydrolipoamide dehydrogenase (E3) component